MIDDLYRITSHLYSNSVFIIICLVLIFSNQIDANSAPFLIKESQSYYEIRSSIEILQDENYSIEEIQTEGIQNQFQRFSEHNLDLKAGQLYWGKIELINMLPDAGKHLEWVLHLSSGFTRIDVFVQQSDGSFEQQLNGTFVPNTRKEFTPTSSGNLVNLQLHPQQIKLIYFKGISERPSIKPSFYTRLVDADRFYMDLYQERTLNFLFIGFVSMMMIYNVILYFFWWDKSSLYYSGYLFTIVFYSLFITQELANWFEPILFPEHPQYLYFGKLIIYLGTISYLSFLKQFLDLKTLAPKWNRYFSIFIVVGLIWMFFDTTMLILSNFSFVATDVITISFVLLFIISSFVFLFPLYKTKDKKGYFIIAGVLVMNFGLLGTAISRTMSTEFSVLYLRIGTILEIVVFSLGLAFRQKENEKIRQQTRFELEKTKLLQVQAAIEKNRLKELDNYKTKLYANITHEFRTPLTVIQGMAGQINGRYKKETQLIRRNTQQLLHLVNQMLELAKLESGTLRLHPQQGDIISFLKYEIESYITLATSYHIDLTFTSSSDVINMDFDIQKLRRILSNLLSNAIKFMSSKGVINIDVTKYNQIQTPHIQIRVTDNGAGIPALQLPYIFDRFYQVDTSATRLTEGTGIGLALTKELVELMKGNIEVESQVDKGTTFIIQLPITQNAPIGETEYISSDSLYNEQVKPNISHPIINNSNHSTVLLIEDNTDVIQYLIACLQDDYQILTALNGQEGIHTAITQTPDIIISDVMMPKADGFEVTQVLKQDERTSHIPIILLTAKADQESKLEGLESGADAYLSKPFDKSELMIRLAKLIEIRKKLQVYYVGSALEISNPEEEISKEAVFLQKLKSHVDQHLDDSDYNIEELAKDMLLSRQQLYRKTKALTGKSVAAYVRLIRLHHAKKLLQKTHLNVSEVAYRVGFSDPGYFSKSFSEEFGYAPSVE